MNDISTDSYRRSSMNPVDPVFSVCSGQAGASSMWASCCGLLNEVMGTGTVRAQQPGFGAGAGPFRFAPSAGYSTYPPTSSGSAGQLCKACGLAFSVFRRKVRVRDSGGTSRPPETSFLHTTFTSALQTLRACSTQSA